jgi:S-adenosyl-L-methionine hydrolase (adenosine-forming)
MRLIVLLTDFGWKDGYASILKGVIWGIAPGAVISDLTHEIAPQDIFQGALTLGRAAPYFPPGTIFLSVVDPGVGTSRRPLAARLGEQFFVGPDNGLLTLLLEDAERHALPVECVHLTQPQFWLPRISSSFHGRDIFAPVAAHLALDVRLAEMGPAVTDPVRLRMPVPQRSEAGWQGEIIHIDAFGNLATNLRSEHLQGRGKMEVLIADQQIRGLVRSFGEGIPGQFVALIDSSGALSICQVNSSAERSLGVKLGDGVEVRFVR